MFLGRDASVSPMRLFEAVSGLTATGATVLTGLDHLPPGMLLWRSILQWIGGVGIVVMALVMLPFLRVGGMQLFRTESSDRSDKFMPRVGEVISLIAVTYLCLTIACGIAYYWAGMNAFDALNHAMTTVSTAGFSTHDRSFGILRQQGHPLDRHCLHAGLVHAAGAVRQDGQLQVAGGVE
jgi:trk system potassium uptake protein TrkH